MPPIRYVRLRRALTGRRSGGARTPDALSVRRGPLRTVKCASERVYGESVWLELVSVDSWCRVLLNVGPSTILGSASNADWCGGGEPEWNGSSGAVDEMERRRRERGGLCVGSWLWAE